MAGLVALLATPAWAEAPICSWDTKARTFDGIDGQTTYYVTPYANSFVASTSSYFDDTNPSVRGTELWGILHHCDSDRHLSFRVGEDDEGREIVKLFYTLLDASEKFTMTELADTLRGRGAEVWQGTGGIGDCDCAYADLVNSSE